MNAIEAKRLTKAFGDKVAVNHIDLTIPEGQLFALLGVNGAGKTTTIRMLSGLSTPTAGECAICGHDCRREQGQAKALIGLSPQETSVAENLTVWENLIFMARVYGCGKEADARAQELLDMFSMGDARNKRAKTLSGGWKRKLSIAMALVGKPKVLFLDEPTLGLDVLARRELWRAIEALKGQVTILLTTHYMEEAEHLAERIAVMLDGRIAACGTLAELERATGQQGLENVFVAIAEGGAHGA